MGAALGSGVGGGSGQLWGLVSHLPVHRQKYHWKARVGADVGATPTGRRRGGVAAARAPAALIEAICSRLCTCSASSGLTGRFELGSAATCALVVVDIPGGSILSGVALGGPSPTNL